MSNETSNKVNVEILGSVKVNLVIFILCSAVFKFDQICKMLDMAVSQKQLVLVHFYSTLYLIDARLGD